MSEGYLTTHVLDTARGLPARGVSITLYRLDGDTRQSCASAVTNQDGRTDLPVLPKGQMIPGIYEMVFDAEAYLASTAAPRGEPGFLGVIPIRFGISDAQAHYHVPLLLSPFGYSTYRGS